MGLSKRAKRGIAAMSHLQWGSPRRARYHIKQNRIMLDFNTKVTPDIVDSAMAAADTLKEIQDAELHTVSEGQNNSVPENPEVGAQQSVSVEPEAGKATPENSQGGDK